MSELAVVKINGGLALAIKSKPNGISFQWLDANRNAVDMSVGSWSGQGRAEAVDGVASPGLGTGNVNIDTGTATATYAWHSDDFAAVGVFRLIIWVGNGSLRYGSAVFEWEVADAPGSDPTV